MKRRVCVWEESQRDSETKPRVARHELLWANIQAPSSKIQITSKIQIPSSWWHGAWLWELLWILDVGSWMFIQGSSCLATLGGRTQSFRPRWKGASPN